MKKVLFLLLAIIILLLSMYTCSQNKAKRYDSSGLDSSTTVKPTESSASAAKPTSTSKPTPTPEPIPTPEPELVTVASDTKNMKIGDITRENDFFVGLAYAKRGDTTKDSFSGSDNEIDPDHEVIFGFFDIYNTGLKLKTFDKNCIVGYCDSVKVQEVESYFLFSEDGVAELQEYDLDEETSAKFIVNFEVPRGWKEFRFFCGDSAWVLTADEVADIPYENQVAFTIEPQRAVTAEGTCIYSDEYELVFDGFEIYRYETLFETELYAVFEYTVNNTGNTEIDYSLAGHNMRAYHNNYLLDGASYIMTDKIGDYINIFKAEEIKPGMSAKIYVPFKVSNSEGSFFMVYDTGFITNEFLGVVNVLN